MEILFYVVGLSLFGYAGYVTGKFLTEIKSHRREEKKVASTVADMISKN